METHTKLWNRDYTRAFLGNFFVTLVANGLPGVFTLFLLARGGTDLDSGIATAAFYIVSLIACPVAGWIVDNRGRKKLLILALIGMVAIPWLFLLVPWIVGLILTRTLHGIMESVSLTTITTNAYDALDEAHFSEGIGIGFNFSGMQIMSVRIVKPERRGAAASTYSCGWNLSAGLGGLIAGVLVTLTNYKTMFIIMLAVYPAYALLYFAWGCKQPSAFRVWKATQEGAKA